MTALFMHSSQVQVTNLRSFHRSFNQRKAMQVTEEMDEWMDALGRTQPILLRCSSPGSSMVRDGQLVTHACTHRSRVMGVNQLFPPSAIRWNRFSALTKAALFENGSLDASEFNRASSIASGGDGISGSTSLSTMISGAAVTSYAGAVDELLCRCLGTSVNKLSGQIS